MDNQEGLRASLKDFLTQRSSVFTLLLFVCCLISQPAESACWGKWGKRICHHFYTIWTEGDNNLYLSGYAWHNRYMYPPEKIRTYNEAAWGGGIGRGMFDENGDWQGFAALAFLDSHKNIEPNIGYLYLKMAHPTPKLAAGAGLSLLITARSDINHGIPIPGILPWLEVRYDRAALMATYIPGASGAGNVLYILGQWTFG